MNLQYGQAYETVSWAMGTRNGRPSAWSMLHEIGAGVRFDSAFQKTYGVNLEEAEILSRDAWVAEASSEPDPVNVTVRIGPTESDVEVNVTASAGVLWMHASGSAAAGTAYSFEMQPDGTLVQTSGGLDLVTEALDEDEEEYGAYVSISIRRGDEVIERVALVRNYGRREPSSERVLVKPNGERRGFERLPSALSDPFPSGDAIVATYPRR
jgi:hypothetical protein